MQVLNEPIVYLTALSLYATLHRVLATDRLAADDPFCSLVA